MRLKNIKNANEIIKKSIYFIEYPYSYKSKWKYLFDNKNPIEIEIGMGKGDFLIKKAINNKKINYIGIEKYPSVLVSVVKKLNQLNLSNLKIICIDAFYIDEIFDKEISKLYLNFSDPWPKKRHSKRRLTNPIYLYKYEKIFNKKVIIEMKTDNDDLFSYSLNSFKENKYKIIKKSNNYKSKFKTEYERKFILKNKNINYVKVFKNLI